jgi:transcriptional/translational regulatory protein YebC/TACO1
VITTKFTDFGTMQKFLESQQLEATSAELQFLPTTTKDLTESEADEVLKLVNALEEDEDVQSVYHNVA